MLLGRVLYDCFPDSPYVVRAGYCTIVSLTVLMLLGRVLYDCFPDSPYVVRQGTVRLFP